VPKIIEPITRSFDTVAFSLNMTMPTSDRVAMTTALQTAYATDISSARSEKLNVENDATKKSTARNANVGRENPCDLCIIPVKVSSNAMAKKSVSQPA